MARNVSSSFLECLIDGSVKFNGCYSIKVSFDVPSYKHDHEDSLVDGWISVVSPVEGTRDWRDPAERRLATSSRDRGSGGGSGGGNSFSLNYGELQCYSPKVLL